MHTVILDGMHLVIPDSRFLTNILYHATMFNDL